MIKKSKRIIASLLMTLSLMTILPATNAFAVPLPVTEEENTNYKQFLKDECTPTENKFVFYNSKDGKYYGTIFTNDYGPITKAKNCKIGDFYTKEDGSLVENTWMYVSELDGGKHWEYYGSDYKRKTGLQTINGKTYNLRDHGLLKQGWWRDIDDNYSWYYSYPDGSVKEGWLNDGGNWYYIYADGKMAKDTTTPDGYSVNKKGICI